MRYEPVFVGNAQVRKVNDRVASRILFVWARWVSKVHGEEISDRSIEDVLLTNKVSEQHDLASGTERIADRDAAVFDAAVGGLV